MNLRVAWSLCGALLLLAHCEQEKPSAPLAPPTALMNEVKEAPNDRVPEVELESIPTEEDFEREAAVEITTDNLEAELDRLEQELLAE